MNLRELLNLDKKLIFLENVNGDRLGVLNSYIQDVKFSPRFNSISTLSFRIYKDECPYYSQITSWRRIQIQDLMKFIIEKPLESNDGLRKYKEITCRSLEIDINRKTIPLLQGTFKFYSILPSDETICSIVLSYLPNWTIESVDSELWNVFRTFDLQDRPLYQMMMEDIENAYECIFDFNTLNQTIKIKAFENIPKKSDIYLSFDNLVNELNITEDTENLITSITVQGANGLAINVVNPLGNTIYNFQHFATTEYMSTGLVTAINNWESLIATNQTAYSNNLVLRKTKISERITLETQLVELQSQLKSLTEVRDALLDSGLDATVKNREVRAKQAETTTKETEITNKQIEIDNIDTALQNIQSTVSIQSYFTPSQLLELEPFIINISVTDENFTKNEIDTDLDIQNTAQDLYNKYKRYLDIASKMRYKFSIDLINFISIQEYKLFTQQLGWGITVNLETESNGIAHPMLLGLDINLDNESDVQFLFGEDLRYEDKAMSYEYYLANQLSNVSNMVTGSSIKWGEYINSGAKDRVWDLFKNGLNADLIPIKNAENEEFLINKNGLIARELLQDGTYSSEQLKIIHNRLAFTDDNFSSLKTVVGKVTLPDLTTAYGINGEVLMGNLIAGNQLAITNNAGNFTIDNNGIKISDMALTITHFDDETEQEIDSSFIEAINNLNSNIYNYVDNIKVELEAQIDGSQTSWFENGVPTLSNVPTINWTTDELKTQHLGDLYYDKETGYAYRFGKDTSMFLWVRIVDNDVLLALYNASKAQDTADGKRTIYTITPNVPYSIGDLWYVTNIDGVDFRICMNDKTKDENFSVLDWINVNKTKEYIDNQKLELDGSINSLNNIIATVFDDNYITNIEAQSLKLSRDTIIKEAEDVKAIAITLSVVYTTLTNSINNLKNEINKYIDQPIYPIAVTDGQRTIINNAFIALKNAINSLYKDIDEKRINTSSTTIMDYLNGAISSIENGMITTYYQEYEPLEEDTNTGDLWFCTAKTGYAAGKLWRFEKTYISSSWNLIQDKGVTEAINKAQDAQTTADGKIVTYYANQISDTNISPNVTGVVFGNGDIWFNTNNGKNTTYRYNEATLKWILIKDKEITDNSTNLTNLTTKIGNAFKYNGILDANKIDGMIDTTKAYMSAVNNQVLFDSTGMWSMNNATKNLATEAVWLNERGILLGVRENTGEWLAKNFSTAITAHGINADYITSGQINAIDIIGGNIDIGNGNFTVDGQGNLVAKSGEFTGTITASNFNQGEINGSSININDNFVVDSSGNLTLAGDVIMGGNITWNSKPSYTAEEIGALPSDTYIPTLPSYIKSTKITSTTIESPTISAGDFYGSLFHGSAIGSAFIKIGVGNGSNLGDLSLYRGGSSTPIFQIYDNLTRVDLMAQDESFLATTGITTYAYGTWNFTSANIVGISTVAKFA